MPKCAAIPYFLLEITEEERATEMGALTQPQALPKPHELSSQLGVRQCQSVTAQWLGTAVVSDDAVVDEGEVLTARRC